MSHPQARTHTHNNLKLGAEGMDSAGDLDLLGRRMGAVGSSHFRGMNEQ